MPHTLRKLFVIALLAAAPVVAQDKPPKLEPIPEPPSRRPPPQALSTPTKRRKSPYRPAARTRSRNTASRAGFT